MNQRQATQLINTAVKDLREAVKADFYDPEFIAVGKTRSPEGLAGKIVPLTCTDTHNRTLVLNLRFIATDKGVSLAAFIDDDDRPMLWSDTFILDGDTLMSCCLETVREVLNRGNR